MWSDGTQGGLTAQEFKMFASNLALGVHCLVVLELTTATVADVQRDSEATVLLFVTRPCYTSFFNAKKRVALKQESDDELVRTWSNYKFFFDYSFYNIRNFFGFTATAWQPSCSTSRRTKARGYAR